MGLERVQKIAEGKNGVTLIASTQATGTRTLYSSRGQVHILSRFGGTYTLFPGPAGHSEGAHQAGLHVIIPAQVIVAPFRRSLP